MGRKPRVLSQFPLIKNRQDKKQINSVPPEYHDPLGGISLWRRSVNP